MNLKNILLTKLEVPKKLNSFILKIKSIVGDKAFIYTAIALLIKILIFLLITSSDTANKVNFKTVFYSVPPILVYFSFILIFLSFSYLFKGRYHIISLFSLNIILTIIIIGDVVYYRANSSFLSPHLLSYTSNLENLSDSILSMFRWIDILFIIDTLVLGIYLIKKRNLYNTFKRSISSFLILFISSCVYLGYAHIKIDKIERSFINQTIFVNSWAQNQTMSNLTPIGYHLFDIYNFMKDSKTYTLSNSEKTNINSFFKDKAEILPDNKYKGMFNGKNLIVLQVESLENFVIGKSVGSKEITPNINKLLKNSVYFNNFLEQTHEGTTSDAELMCNTSVFPLRRGGTFFRFPSNSYPSSLPNLMESIGYSSIAIHPDRGSYWNWLPSLSSIGFNKCIDSTSLDLKETIGLGLSDESFLTQLADILEKQPKPFFSFSITLTSHTPFSLPKENVKLPLPENLKGTSLGSYFEAVNYTDFAIGKFLDILDKKKILDNSVIVLYGDHEGVHKYFKDEITSSSSAEPWMKDNGYKVPFIIYSKDLKPNTVSTLGGQIDILPTLSYLMGVDRKDYIYSSVGRNLLNTNLNYTYTPSGKLQSENLPNSKAPLLEKAVEYSDIIIRSNYFRKE